METIELLREVVANTSRNVCNKSLPPVLGRLEWFGELGVLREFENFGRV